MNTNKKNLLSACCIAKELRRSAQGVRDAIGRLGIRPEFEVANGNYYAPAVVETLRKEMRARTGEGTRSRQQARR